jgi:hypothetical protein
VDVPALAPGGGADVTVAASGGPAAPAPAALRFRDEPGANDAEVMYLSFDGGSASVFYPEDETKALVIVLSQL